MDVGRYRDMRENELNGKCNNSYEKEKTFRLFIDKSESYSQGNKM